MNSFLITLFSILYSVNGYAQNSIGDYINRYTQTIKKENLSRVQLMSEIIPDYPQEYYNKTLDYISIVIFAFSQGNVVQAIGSNDTLTAEQKQLINNTDLGCELNIDVHFKYKDSSNDLLGGGGKIKKMTFKVTAVPDTEAEFPGGYKQITNYFNENFVKSICDTCSIKTIPNIAAKFTVNEEGKVVNVRLIKSSGNSVLDQFILDLTKNMHSWKPAENLNGQKTKEDFTIQIPIRKSGC